MMTILYNNKVSRGFILNTDIIAFNVGKEDVDSTVEILIHAIKTQFYLRHGLDLQEMN